MYVPSPTSTIDGGGGPTPEGHLHNLYLRIRGICQSRVIAKSSLVSYVFGIPSRSTQKLFHAFSARYYPSPYFGETENPSLGHLRGRARKGERRDGPLLCLIDRSKSRLVVDRWPGGFEFEPRPRTCLTRRFMPPWPTLGSVLPVVETLRFEAARFISFDSAL
ncbi:hypothetical protein EDB86DRAFT_2077928 [Lactarius hatsudake]|nr:hypothetical protein EDB86DRAFT_2077928 [Lactarius hatsudake]